ncbi:hypothetical protein [Pedobacter antarcticus]|uniref:hypothetical protein n=1 Tax=Pedobacter antarcticus TaxID=34086 RepID=UPI00293182F5|nr:hypothetical protein [Pedobacter antarcticus]
MNTVKDRLNELITELKLSKNEFAREVGISSAMISKITTKDVNFGIDVYQRIISRYPSLNQQWLLFGAGEIWVDKQAIEQSLRPSLKGKAIKDIKADEELIIVSQIRSGIKKVNFLYQTLIDIRILQNELLGTKKELSTEKESGLLWDLAKADIRLDDDEQPVVAYRFEVVDLNGKQNVLNELLSCIDLFTNTFFIEFKSLYKQLRKPF